MAGVGVALVTATDALVPFCTLTQKVRIRVRQSSRDLLEQRTFSESLRFGMICWCPSRTTLHVPLQLPHHQNQNHRKAAPVPHSFVVEVCDLTLHAARPDVLVQLLRPLHFGWLITFCLRVSRARGHTHQRRAWAAFTPFTQALCDDDPPDLPHTRPTLVFFFCSNRGIKTASDVQCADRSSGRRHS